MCMITWWSNIVTLFSNYMFFGIIWSYLYLSIYIHIHIHARTAILWLGGQASWNCLWFTEYFIQGWWRPEAEWEWKLTEQLPKGSIAGTPSAFAMLLWTCSAGVWLCVCHRGYLGQCSPLRFTDQIQGAVSKPWALNGTKLHGILINFACVMDNVPWGLLDAAIGASLESAVADLEFPTSNRESIG